MLETRLMMEAMFSDEVSVRWVSHKGSPVLVGWILMSLLNGHWQLLGLLEVRAEGGGSSKKHFEVHISGFFLWASRLPCCEQPYSALYSCCRDVLLHFKPKAMDIVRIQKQKYTIPFYSGFPPSVMFPLPPKIWVAYPVFFPVTCFGWKVTQSSWL